MIMIQLFSFHPRSHHCLWEEHMKGNFLCKSAPWHYIFKVNWQIYNLHFFIVYLTNRQQFSMVCTVIHLIEMSSKRRQNMLLTSVPYKIIPNKTKKPALRPQWSMLITVRWTVFERHIYGVELTRKIIIQEYFQAKIVRKIRIFSLGRKNNILR